MLPSSSSFDSKDTDQVDKQPTCSHTDGALTTHTNTTVDEDVYNLKWAKGK